MESSSLDSQRKNGVEKENGAGFSESSSKKIISTLPNVANAWGIPSGLFKYQDFWHTAMFLEGLLSAQQQFQAQPTDIILCSAPKTGTTWLKSLAFATITRSSYDDSTSPLLSKLSHTCVPCLEFDLAHISTNRDPAGMPLLATHMPYSSLPRSVIESGCKIVYICRDPKDSFVSMYHFIPKLTSSQNTSTSLDEAFELFCEGKSMYGPYWDHVLGYWKASLEHPDKILFLKYEDLSKYTVLNVEKLADFLGYPFSSEEKEKGVPEKIINLCSFDNLSNLEVVKSGIHRGGMIENKYFFRKGKVGDWKNCLTPEMAARLDQITTQKLNGSGLTL